MIVACGSFSPPTYLHLRMFEMAKDQILEEGQYEILGGYYSPVSVVLSALLIMGPALFRD